MHRRSAWFLGIVALTSCADTQGEDERSTRTDCISCHLSEYEGARKHVDKKPTTCGVCHSETSWHRAEREHRWPLTGAHEKADCFSCHEGEPEQYKDTSEACFSCHRGDFEPPPFADHARFSHECDECHSTSDWKHTLPGKGRRSGGSDRK